MRELVLASLPISPSIEHSENGSEGRSASSRRALIGDDNGAVAVGDALGIHVAETQLGAVGIVQVVNAGDCNISRLNVIVRKINGQGVVSLFFSKF